ncbi:MAG: amidohydrolase family protein [Blastopirellula sp. JB062]
MKRCYLAKWLLPVDRPPIENGLLTAVDQQIVAVGENLTGRPPIDLGEVALAPALINAHAHLEFSDIERPLGEAGMSFPAWIRQVVARRQSAGEALEAQKNEAAAQGLRESQAQGIAALGEITTQPFSWEAYRTGPSVVSLLELIGLSPERSEELIAAAEAHLQNAKEQGMRGGLSPHAPYSVHRSVVAAAAKLSAATQTPLAMHLAESQEELQLLDRQIGPFRDMLEAFGAWRSDAFRRGGRPLEYLRLIAEAHRALVIHGNYLDAAELDFVAERRATMTVVYCPRTHAYFEHARYPLPELLRRNAAIAIGTDSRASNPDLAVWRDVRAAAAAFPEVAPDAFWPMVTQTPAAALGVDDRYGSLAVGKRAALIQFRVGAGVSRDDLREALLEADPTPVE